MRGKTAGRKDGTEEGGEGGMKMITKYNDRLMRRHMNGSYVGKYIGIECF